MNTLYLCAPEVVCFDNDNGVFIPEKWAYEGLAQLEEQMVVANLVHRDFENEIADYGDVVNANRPGEFKVRRKNDSTTSLDKQDASAAKVPVKLNQWFYNSFVIKDGEQSMSFKDLVKVYLVPSVRVIARSVDRAVLGHFHKFLGGPSQRAGRLQNLASDTSHQVVLEAREKLNSNNAPIDANRHLVLSSMSETALLMNDLFIKADTRGDGGTALQEAKLGRILGFNTWLAQNVPYCNPLTADTVAGSVTSATPAGTTGAIAVPVSGYVVSAGEYVVLAGNDQPTVATAATGTTDTATITLDEALKYDVAASAVATVYKKCAVKGAYIAGHIDKIEVDGFTASKPPKVGQMVSFGTGSSRHTYTVIESEAGESCQQILLDRPLEANVADNADVFPGPAGAFNLAFQREALALVTRPLAIPNAALGVASGIGVYNDIAMRVSMQYSIDAGGTVVNCDILAGVKELDTNLAVVLLG